MKVISKMDFSWDNIQFKRGKEYDINLTEKFKEFIRVGYLTIPLETKEYKGEVQKKVIKRNGKNRSV